MLIIKAIGAFNASYHHETMIISDQYGLRNGDGSNLVTD